MPGGAIALALLLAACADLAPTTSPLDVSHQPSATAADSAMPRPRTPTPAESNAPDAGTTAPAGRHQCHAAFAALPGELARAPRLDNAGATLDGTLAACESLATWMADADDFFSEADLSHRAVRVFLVSRCPEQVQSGTVCGDL